MLFYIQGSLILSQVMLLLDSTSYIGNARHHSLHFFNLCLGTKFELTSKLPNENMRPATYNSEITKKTRFAESCLTYNSHINW
jgi:hypothetical protein